MLLSFFFITSSLLLISCGSGGGGGSGSQPETASATVNSTGGQVKLADGVNVTIPAGVVADNTQVTLSKVAQPQLYYPQETALTDTYQVSIPVSSITSIRSMGNFIQVQIPIPANASAVIRTPSILNDAYNAVEVAVSDGITTFTEYSQYTLLNNSVTTNVPQSLLLSLTTGNTITLQETAVNIIDLFIANNPSLYFASTTTPLQQVTSPQALMPKTPVILVHGWELFPGGTSDYSTWMNFIAYFYSQPYLYNNFMLYTYLYNPTIDIHDNGSYLGSIIENYFPLQNVVIIAHSMGGLVADSYIQEFNGNQHVTKLITLSTPYHGTPLVQIGMGAVNIAASGVQQRTGISIIPAIDAMLATATPATFDLQWDNSDNNTAVGTTTDTYLQTLNGILSSNQTTTNLYIASGGDSLIPIISPHDLTLLASNAALDLLGYNSDGVVPIVSSFNEIYSNTAGTFVNGLIATNGPWLDYDHYQMALGKTTNDPLFIQIGEILEGLLSETPTYSVFYNANSNTATETVPIDSNNYVSGETVTVLGNTGNLVNIGYNFVGWNTQSDGSGLTYTPGQTFTMGSANVTLYAMWSASGLGTVAKYAYVTNYGDGTVSQYMIGADGSLTFMSTASVLTGQEPTSITADPSGKYVYVVNSYDNTVSQYTIGVNGVLASMTTASVVAGGSPSSVTVDPSGKYAYVSNESNGTISQYTIGTNGELTPMNPATVGALDPGSVAIDPTGKYAYVAVLYGAGNVDQYTIGSDGTLASTNSYISGQSPSSVTVDPSGKYVYTANAGDETISQYTIGTNGALTPMTPSAIYSGMGPESITVDPSGKYVYAVNFESNTVSQYSISANGALTPMTPVTVGTWFFPTCVAVDPSGKYVYVVNNAEYSANGTVSQYTIGANGALIPMTTSMVAAGFMPNSITIVGNH